MFRSAERANRLLIEIEAGKVVDGTDTQGEKSQLNLSFGFMGSASLGQGTAFSSGEEENMKVHIGKEFDTLLLWSIV